MSSENAPPRPVSLVTTKPEAEIAEDLKRRTEEAMKPVLALMDEAAQSGLTITWQGCAPMPPYNRFGIAGGVKITKQY